MKRLIVNADDFGLTNGVNRAVADLHCSRVLTSTTLMARAGATEGAIELALTTPSLGVGCHVVLVDGEPVLPVEKVRSLANARTGAFHVTLSGFLQQLLTGRMKAAEIEAEARAQIERLQARGVRIMHIDAHKHTHMFPPVLRAVLRAARACGVRAVRNPFEPAWAVRVQAGTGLVRAAEVTVLRWLKPECLRIIAEEGFATTDGTIAMVGTGVLDAAMVRRLLKDMPDGTWELVTHPGYNDAELARVRTRLRESRDIEREALQAIREFPEIELISFSELAGSRPLRAH